MSEANVSPALLAALRAELLVYYRRAARELPWRRSRDPYAIWVSEIMLQQTQVATVAPRYQAFLAAYPSVAALAAASEQAVCEAWAGLGYYRRARLLHAAARQVVAAHAGAMPADVAALRALPGIGRYTAGAIASIAFGIAAPLVDGNVERVFARLFMLAAPEASPAGRARLWELAAALVLGEDPGALNQALMDLGATVCTPQRPRCDACPVRAHCAAHRADAVARYPAPKVRRPPTQMAVAFAYAEAAGATYLSRRPRAGLWAGLWEPPSASAEGPAAARAALALRVGRLGPCLAEVQHALTHRRIVAHVYAWPRPPAAAPADAAWVAEPLAAPLSALARKALRAAAAAAAPPAAARTRAAAGRRAALHA